MGKVFSKERYFEQTGYTPHEGQRIFHDSNARFRVASNGRRFGKSLMGAKEAEPMAFLKNHLGMPLQGWIVGPQYIDCEAEFSVIYDNLRAIGVDKHSIKFINNRESGNMHIKTTWGFDLDCRSAAHPETLVAKGLDFVLMVEAGRHKRKTWAQYVRPTLSDKRGWAIFTGVPEGSSQNNLLYDLYQRGQLLSKPQWQSWKLPSWYNTASFPGGRQDPEILDAEDDLTEAEFNRQYGAEFVENVGRVMQDWDDDLHLDTIPYRPNLPLYAAMDYGFVDPFVLLWIQVDEFNNIYVIRERRWTGVDTTDVCADILNNPIDSALARACVAFYPDPAEPDRTRTVSNRLSIPARGSTGGSIKTRLELIWSALKVPQHLRYLEEGHPERKPRLMFDREDTKEIQWEMREGYRWPEHKSEVRNSSELPLDKDNHGPEALGRFFKGYYGHDLDRSKSVVKSRRARTRR